MQQSARPVTITSRFAFQIRPRQLRVRPTPRRTTPVAGQVYFSKALIAGKDEQSSTQCRQRHRSHRVLIPQYRREDKSWKRQVRN